MGRRARPPAAASGGCRSLLPMERLDSIDLFAIIGLLPHWRSVGRMIIETNAIPLDRLSLVLTEPS